MALTNPLLDVLSGLHPEAQQAVANSLNSTKNALAPPPAPDPGLQAPSKIQKPAQIGAPNLSTGGLDSRGAADNPNAPKPEPTLQPPSMGTEVPNLGTPTMPNVSKQPTALEALTAKRDEMADKGAGITQIHSKIENSQFGQNHPTLGKIAGYGAEIPLRVLEAAGAMFGPTRSAEMLLPGTQAHHAIDMRNLNTTIGKESEENLKGAQTGVANANAGHLTEETAEMPQKEADTHALTQSTVDKNEREKAQTLQQLHATAVNKAIQEGRDPSTDPTVNHLADQIISLQPGQNKEAVTPKGEHVNVMGPNGKPMVATYHPDTGKTTDATGKEIANPVPYEKSPQAPGITMIVPDPNNPGSSKVERLTAGQTVGPGAQTAAGVNAVNTPTTQQRTAAGRAATVVAMAPEVLSEIDRLAPKLGPIEGRWNDFIQGKVGMDDPEFAGLRTDLVMLSSAVALAHAVGRLPENLRLEFDHMINAPQQTPENIKATINHVLPWLQKMQEQGGGRQGAAEGGDVVYDDKGVGHRYNGTGNRNDPKNYTAVQ